jgi:hypothetical protein
MGKGDLEPYKNKEIIKRTSDKLGVSEAYVEIVIKNFYRGLYKIVKMNANFSHKGLFKFRKKFWYKNMKK